MQEFIERYNSLRDNFKFISPFIDDNKHKIKSLEKIASSEGSTFLVFGSLSFYMHTPRSDVDAIILTNNDYSSQRYLLQKMKKSVNFDDANDLVLMSNISEVIDPDNFLNTINSAFDIERYESTILTGLQSLIFSNRERGLLNNLDLSFNRYISRINEHGFSTHFLEREKTRFIDYFSERIS